MYSSQHQLGIIVLVPVIGARLGLSDVDSGKKEGTEMEKA